VVKRAIVGAMSIKPRSHDVDLRARPIIFHRWGGYRVAPDRIELWQGRDHRLHDRFAYSLETDGTWRIDRLAP
jgi:pyridoxine/pyridoxamine 5'-phosphate oxidase